MSVLEKINQSVELGKSKGLLQRKIENKELFNSDIILDGEPLKNFGSCSFLGLEFDPSLKEATIQATQSFGTQFSSSRAYASVGLYEELEDLLELVYEKPVIASASTGSGSMAVLPVVVEDGDAVIMDFLVHSTVQLAAQILKARKIITEYIPHNSMEHLEAKIIKLRNKHKRIWYLADGVYSMHGDYAPLTEIESLLNKYKQLHLFIDDAQGNGWTGKKGCGYVRSQIEHHDKMILCTSLNKSFAAGGGAIVLPNKEMKRSVMNCGGTLVFSGPIQPPMLGATIASVKLHLSETISVRQEKLKELVDFANVRMEELGLPQHSVNDSPIFFIPVGYPKVTSQIAMRMKNKGFYLNAAGFPAVPMNKSGLRFTITLNLTQEDVNAMLTTLQREYVLGVEETGSSLEEISKNFRIGKINLPTIRREEKKNSELTLKTYSSISQINEEEWNLFFKDKGNFTYQNILQLESIFKNNDQQENNWEFYYQEIKDVQGQVILFSICSIALMMDDLMADEEISKKIREIRTTEPYYLSSKWLITGTPFTKGDAYSVNLKSNSWKDAVKCSLDDLKALAIKTECSQVLIRDFKAEKAEELSAYMGEQGLLKMSLPNNMISDLSWKNKEEYISKIPSRYRYSLRKEILKHEDDYIVRSEKKCSQEEIETCYNLYKNVHSNAMNVSVFELPKALFEFMFESDEYDIIRMYHKSQPNKIIGVMFSHLNGSTYNAMIVGLDYDYVKSLGTYKQILYRTVLRAKELDYEKLDLAFTAEMEKKKVGAVVESTFAFSLAFDHYSHAVMQTYK